LQENRSLRKGEKERLEGKKKRVWVEGGRRRVMNAVIKRGEGRVLRGFLRVGQYRMGRQFEEGEQQSEKDTDEIVKRR